MRHGPLRRQIARARESGTPHEDLQAFLTTMAARSDDRALEFLEILGQPVRPGAVSGDLASTRDH